MWRSLLGTSREGLFEDLPWTMTKSNPRAGCPVLGGRLPRPGWEGRGRATTCPPGRSSQVLVGVRIANLAIARLHVAEPSEAIMRVTRRDGKLRCVTVFVLTPVAPVYIHEWFELGVQNHFYVRQIKGVPPMVRVQFPSSLPDAQRRKAFAVRKPGVWCSPAGARARARRTSFLASGS